MRSKADPAGGVFNRDIAANAGYLYTTNARLSSWLANRRQTDMALAAVDFWGKRVIDIGCGDGTYTVELFDRGKPRSMQGVDVAQEAIRVARAKVQGRKVSFEVNDSGNLPYEKDSFDIAHLRGLLHHMDKPLDTLREALRVAPTLVVIEPNGYNPILKLIERFSRYHVEHHEKSYMPASLDHWVNGLGGTIVKRQWFGLVPFFCPDGFARAMKRIEPVIERLPLIRAIICGSYLVVATHFRKLERNG